METDKTHKHRVRAKAKRNGHTVGKSRSRPNVYNRGLFMLADDRNHIVLGGQYDASLEQIEEYLDRLVEGVAA